MRASGCITAMSIFQILVKPISTLHESESHSLMSDFLRAHGLYTQSMKFSRPEYWSGQPFTSPGELPDPGIEPSSPTLLVDSLRPEPQGNPKDTGVGSLFLLQLIFLSQGSNRGLLHCRQILYGPSSQESPALYICCLNLQGRYYLHFKDSFLLSFSYTQSHYEYPVRYYLGI